MINALAIAGQDKEIRARQALRPEQILFAEWLALPMSERHPSTQKELSAQLGVSDQTLSNWKDIPEIWDVRDSLLTTKAKGLVSDALKVLEDRLKDPEHKKLALDAAKEILDRWSEPKRHAAIVVSLADLYKQYHPEESK